VEVLDATGRRMLASPESVISRDARTWRWDGRDARGRALPPGRYLVRARVGDVVRAATLVKLP